MQGLKARAFRGAGSSTSRCPSGKLGLFQARCILVVLFIRREAMISMGQFHVNGLCNMATKVHLSRLTESLVKVECVMKKP